jgi:Fe-S oxidoreductase
MLREDYPSLLPGDDASAVAAAVQPVEGFVAPKLAALPSFGGNVLFHQHCHQRASYGPADTVTALQRAGFAVTETPPNCCGMAGAFGFEAEHYDISKRVGELSTLPAVRAAADGTTICATGTSCRQQIGDLAGREARHPIEVIAGRLPNTPKAS